MSIEEHKRDAPKSFRFAVLTITDKRTEKSDVSGKLLREVLKREGHSEVHYDIIANDENLISNKVRGLLSGGKCDVVITVGGTGLSRRDVTIEAVEPLLEKRLEGFGELFRSLSFQEIGSAAIMSRALAGTISKGLVICLPGSEKAVSLALEKIILPELPHAIAMVSE